MALCSVPGCKGVVVARGLCMKHYKQSRRNNAINLEEKPEHCTHPGCKAKVYSKGLCRKHYNQQYYKKRTGK
jgi:hypothetical protein